MVYRFALDTQSVAGHDTSQLVQFGIGGGCPTRDRALPSCLQAKQSADVDDHEGIVRPIASKSAITLHLGLPHS